MAKQIRHIIGCTFFSLTPAVLTLAVLMSSVLTSAGQVYAAPPEIMDIIPSQTTGVAPLAIHFDASRVIHNGQVLDPIRDVSYQWNFGDSDNQYWSTSQQSKNTDNGFIAAHLFESPGNYEIRVKISSPESAFDTVEQSVSVEVLHPDEVYPGEQTVCFSRSGDYSGCPYGAQLVQLTANTDITQLLAAGKFQGSKRKQQRLWNPYKEYALSYDHNSTFEYLDYEQSWDCRTEVESHSRTLLSAEQLAPFIGTNTRLLFKRGETFTFFNSISLDNANGATLGAYGTCTSNTHERCDNAPTLEMLGAGSAADLLILSDGSTDIKITDLSINHLCGDRNRAINMYGSASQLLFDRLTIQGFDTAIIGRTYGQTVPHNLISIFNSKFEKMGAGQSAADDPGSNECDRPVLPDWHTGDRNTPIAEALWNEQWAEYKLQLLETLTNNNCKTGGNIAYLPAHRHMIMGTQMSDAVTKRAEHVLRIPLAHKSVIAHNTFEEPAPNKHALKLHNQGDCVILDDCDINPVQSAENYPTNWVLIRENLFKSNTDIVVSIGPGTSKVGEQVNHILFESNRVEASGELNQFAIGLASHHSTVRNNQLVQDHPTNNWTGISIAKGKNEPEQADNNRVVQNHASVNGPVDLVRLHTGTDEAQINNNRVCSTALPTYVDLADPGITHMSEGNQWDCTQNNLATGDSSDNDTDKDLTPPLFHLTFDNPDNPAMDAMNNVSAILYGNIDLPQGKVGKAISFDDIRDEIIIPDPMNGIESTGELSLMVWINMTDFGAGSEAFGRPRLNRQGDISLTIDDRGKLLFYLNSKHINPDIRLQPGIWTHLALTYNQSERTVRVYLNGNETYQYPIPASTPLYFDTGQEFRLGLGQWRSGSRYFSGQLDEFKLYDVELSPEEILLHFQNESSEQIKTRIGALK
ncbi:LamG-like jellyroll fold domain-containing protein [Motiliproteus sp. MSK22-1]|uniref:LamG-like jellyroll fold domain-containing protein n=1 Tax=Motiliproteus sp. MSK22-1 TaxID=1897630 RepID=UPI0013011E43|nr:LamG-like jellyroll fold domain-containing protein [Motiliproteus sp. MSK22-1]